MEENKKKVSSREAWRLHRRAGSIGDGVSAGGRVPIAGQGLCVDGGGVVREEFQCALQGVVVQCGQVGEQRGTDPA